MILRSFIEILLMLCLIAHSASGTDMLQELQPGQKIQSFRTMNLYENEESTAVGARFISEPYSFVLDLFRIQSVPQALFWVKTLPQSDKGEPHTCEHLLLGKGNRARAVSALETMTLTSV